MLSLKEKAEVYHIGLVTGLFMKDDVISWADKIIETQENIEYEIIEISLLESSSKADIASKLFEIKGLSNNQNVLYTFLGLCSSNYNSHKYNTDEICTFLYRLISSKIEIPISLNIKQRIQYLSDGYYLASEGIYENLKDIIRDLKDFLNQYIDYAKEFNL